MSADGTIVASRLWKRFRADRTRPVLRDELERIRGGTGRGYRWVLRDIDFRIEPGESVGLFGTNGSGKSTLLKILTRVMYPHSGRLEVAGRVGALIEIKAGIHPDLTGRENVYLYGSLMGLPRAEVATRFDEIVDFAELEGALDRQVKFYSSGMGMRLGFAVAAFLNPSVLMVDEVLAVGDAAFQQKCLNRMRAVLAEGTTLIFVSHDLATVEATCERGLWLHEGVLAADEPVRDALAKYRQEVEHLAEVAGSQSGVSASVTVEGHGGAQPTTHSPISINLHLESDRARAASVALGVTEGTASPIFVTETDVELAEGSSMLACVIRDVPLPSGRYFVWISVSDGDTELLTWQPARVFDLEGPPLVPAPKGVLRLAPVHVAARWQGDVVRPLR